MLVHSDRCGTQETFLIGEMPQASYEVSRRDALINVLRFEKEANCDGIKLSCSMW